jgi:hypothetical protein
MADSRCPPGLGPARAVDRRHGMVIYLLFAELFSIKAICLCCTSVHVMTFAIFVLVMISFPAMLEWTAGERGESQSG